ncbi:MAG: hypothetical protein AAGI72_23855 [Pseudomonadota bacterium]
MSLFRLVKYSSLLYFLGKHRGKLFRSIAILLFAFVTSLLYEDLRVYLESQHPESLAYALIAKVVIVYGSLAFVLFQFRPRKSGDKQGEARAAAMPRAQKQDKREPPADRLSRLEDVDDHRKLRSRYDRVLMGDAKNPDRPTGKSGKS